MKWIPLYPAIIHHMVGQYIRTSCRTYDSRNQTHLITLDNEIAAQNLTRLEGTQKEVTVKLSKLKLSKSPRTPTHPAAVIGGYCAVEYRPGAVQPDVQFGFVPPESTP